MGSDKIGDYFFLHGPGRRVEVEIIEVQDGHCTKARAKVPHPDLGKIGFFMEGDDWVIFDFNIVTAN